MPGEPRMPDGVLPAGARPAADVPGWAVASAALTPVLLTAGWLIGDALQPPSYSPVRSTVSALAGQGGADSWVMTSAMLLAGGAYLLTAAGLGGLGPAGRVLLVLAGLCAITVAIRPEATAGPPPLHVAATAVGALAITAWPLAASWRAPALPGVLSLRNSAMVAAAFAVMLIWVLYEIRYGQALGAAERATASLQTTWPFVVAMARRLAPAMPLAGASGSVAGQPGPGAGSPPGAGSVPAARVTSQHG